MSKVVLLKVDDYDEELLREKLKEGFRLLGGIEKFVPPGSKVLLKPNLLSARRPEECVTTHPVVIKAVVNCIRGFTEEILIGDSPGGTANYDEVLDKSGIRQLAEELGIKIIRFERAKMMDGIPIAEEVFNSDLIISLPKFKTHSLTVITAGVKNCFGLVPGLFKTDAHRKYPKADDFSPLLLKIYKIVKPAITILDGIWAMEGDGPANGMPRKVGLMLMSPDAVALDSLVAYLIGLTPMQIPTNRAAYQEGVGETDLDKIEILGEKDIENLRISDFKLPKTSILERVPRPFIFLLGRIIKFYPEVNLNKCVKCGICVNACPANAIEMGKDSVRIDHKRCILCLCCHELCPQGAIDVRKNYFARRLGL
jgi:uncharacterized protein (DUF362 family)/Pyruvate/2-oxoacid:ferredoxin oxidoreductase delta subunit